jgi:hypothetical protein
MKRPIVLKQGSELSKSGSSLKEVLLMPKISDALLFDLLSCFRLKQVSLAIEVLRGRVTADQLMPMKVPSLESEIARARALLVEVRKLDEEPGSCSCGSTDLPIKADRCSDQGET